MVEAAKLSAMYVFGMVGAFIVGTGAAMLFALLMKSYYLGWIFIFGMSTISAIGYGLSIMFLMFTAMFAAMMKEG
jgi:hypothetical protein